MQTVNIFDNTCQHHLREDGYWTSTAKRRPKNIQFVQRCMEFDGITLFTDDYILSDEVLTVKSKLKIAWCLESPAVQPHVHNNINKISDRFDYIFTYREDLIRENPEKFKPNSPGGTYIEDRDISLYLKEKNKNCSLVLSGKKTFPGHILRHQIQSLSQGVDCYGWGSPGGAIDNKIVALKNYKYHLVIENIQMTHYFTEKLIDCLLTGCVPIYYGAPNIDQYFNIDGFIICKSLEDFQSLKITKEDFENRKEAIVENFDIAHKYISSDDYLASKLLPLLK
jgi:hypothetical protein